MASAVECRKNETVECSDDGVSFTDFVLSAGRGRLGVSFQFPVETREEP